MPEFGLRTKLEPPFGNHRLQILGSQNPPSWLLTQPRPYACIIVAPLWKHQHSINFQILETYCVLGTFAFSGVKWRTSAVTVVLFMPVTIVAFTRLFFCLARMQGLSQEHCVVRLTTDSSMVFGEEQFFSEVQKNVSCKSCTRKIAIAFVNHKLIYLDCQGVLAGIVA